jgi:hypothetical protein
LLSGAPGELFFAPAALVFGIDIPMTRTDTEVLFGDVGGNCCRVIYADGIAKKVTWHPV